MSILSVTIDINSYIPCITFLITCINANSAHRISIIYTSMTILNIMALYDSHSFSGQQSSSFIMIFLDLDCAKGSLPTDVYQRVLYLQCDNKEKTWTLLAFLGDLVRAGMFTEAHANMLIVGHTHEDIDQFFSRLCIFLARNAGRTSDNGTIDKFFGLTQLH